MHVDERPTNFRESEMSTKRQNGPIKYRLHRMRLISVRARARARDEEMQFIFGCIIAACFYLRRERESRVGLMRPHRIREREPRQTEVRLAKLRATE